MKPAYKYEKSYIDSWTFDQTKSELNEEYARQVKVKATDSTKYLGKVISYDFPEKK